ncbi:Mitochondrial distribution and morphology protein family 31/32 [Venturia nashicola]|uniref:Mitochondrial distribution and morphology protein family 31/32 n=1 Tax=Venturia nashicola TaxID=86259 RepID=A0A4Z1PI05_9PEZI|nr:mitochondrial distribution and morphology protein family 31/32 [Venturia nashicola]TLD39277.1 Mitochondrial distribution and morphology protein family 31/32 [Venturia nashicola]
MLRNVGTKFGEACRPKSFDIPAVKATRSPFLRQQTTQFSTLSSFQPPFYTPRQSPPITAHPFGSRRPIPEQPSIIQQFASSAWKRCAHSRSKRRRLAGEIRNKSSVSNGKSRAPSPNVSSPKAELSPKAKPEKSAQKIEDPIPPTSHHLLDRLPHLPHIHRPTKEELLAAASGAWARFGVRFKWFSIKSARPFNIDDISAFFSWIFVGHLVWLIVGTTTFVSLLVFVVNTVFAQETLARWIGNYLTKSTGVHVIFESAVVPKWKSGVISFQNVFVSRRPGQGKAKVTKGSQSEAAAAAAAAAHAEGRTDPEEDDGNYTQFDVAIDTVNVTLSFAKWFNSKGLLGDVEIKGVRGVIDRTHVRPPTEYRSPQSYKHEHQLGDFELDSFKMEDLLVTIYQPNNFRPFSVSIFSCDLPQLRKQWLFYDFLSANMMSGSFDNSLFTIHPRQTHNYTGQQLSHGMETDGDAMQWKKHTRFRIDGLNIDHLNRGAEGPFSWISQGNVDIVSDIMFPNDEEGIAKVMSDFYDRLEATVTTSAREGLTNARESFSNAREGFANAREGFPLKSGEDHGGNVHQAEHDEPSTTTPIEDVDDNDNRFMIMDLRVHLNDVRATVPLFTKDISYVNNALIRPIVAYINSKRTFIPVNCRVVKKMMDFDGSWTIYDSGLMDDLGREVYEAFARDVLDDDQLRRRRFKKVGVWTLQLAAQALFIGMAGNIA